MKRIATFIVCLILAGCSPTRLVTQYRDRYVYLDSKKVDSVFVRDSFYIKEYVKGDTVRIVEYRDRYLYRNRLVRDTLVQLCHDTTVVSKTIRVEKELTWWQKTRIGAFWILVAAVLFAYRKTIIRLVRLLL